MILYKEYRKLEDKEIKFSISFNKESVNWATGQPKAIGYQVTAIPVKRTHNDGFCMEEFGAFTGFNHCLLAVDRQSKKRLQQAINILQERMDEYLERFK